MPSGILKAALASPMRQDRAAAEGRGVFGLTEFEKAFERIWKIEIRQDAIRDRLRYESDLQSAIYHHLRSRIDPFDEKVFILAQYSPDKYPRGSPQRIDLGIEFGDRGDIRVAIETKLYTGSKVSGAREDLLRLRDYRKIGAERGYFCYVSNQKDPETLQKELGGELTGWVRDYLRVAEGFPRADMLFRVRSY